MNNWQILQVRIPQKSERWCKVGSYDKLSLFKNKHTGCVDIYSYKCGIHSAKAKAVLLFFA